MISGRRWVRYIKMISKRYEIKDAEKKISR